MIITFQGLSVTLPLAGVLALEELVLQAKINQHAAVAVKLMMAEEEIEEQIDQLPEGSKLIIENQGQTIFVGKIMAVELVLEHALNYLYLQAYSYTIDWDLKPETRSFSIESMTYQQVGQQIMSGYENGDIYDCVSKGAAIPGFLLQYEETDWTFLKRLATHFAACLVPDLRADFGRVYFGIPDEKNQVSLEQSQVSYIRDMDVYLKLSGSDRFAPQDSTRWNIATDTVLELGDTVRLNGVDTIVTGIYYQVIKGELRSAYELSRESGLVYFYEKNPLIYGMSIPGTVMSKQGNRLKVHLDIDPVYQDHPDQHSFFYAIESSRIRSIPKVGGKVHIYFPSHVEQEAIAVHAIRAQVNDEVKKRYTPAPEYKVFSDSNGSQILFTPEMAGIKTASDITSLQLHADGTLKLTGKNITLFAEQDIIIGGGEAAPATVVLGGERTILSIGESGSQTIHLSKNLRLCSTTVMVLATGEGVELVNPNNYESIRSQLKSGDAGMLFQINNAAKQALIAQKKEADALVRKGLFLMGEALAMSIVAVYVPVTAKIAATKIGCVILLIGKGSIAAQAVIGYSQYLEGTGTIENLMNGSFERGENFLVEALGGNRELYEKICLANGIIFQMTSAYLLSAVVLTHFKPLVALCGGQKAANMALHIGKNAMRRAISDFVIDGTFDPGRIMCDMALGFAQGTLGNVLGGALTHLAGGGLGAQILFTTAADVGLDALYSLAFGLEFDPGLSILLNLLANSGSMLIQEPVDAVSGAYYINSDDLVIDGICTPITLSRMYLSTNQQVSCMGKGWRFSYDSRIWQEQQRLYLNLPTGHLLLFEPVGERGNRQWQLLSTGCDWFSLEEGGGFSWTFKVCDHKNLVTYLYDQQGLLVEEQNRQGVSKRFIYDEEQQLTKIAFPGNHETLLRWRDGKIITITDWSGRSICYEYEQDYLVKVRHVDMGQCTYRYGRNGYLEQVTDQTGSVYLTNEYDRQGRIVRQELANGEFYEMTHDDSRRLVISYYSGRNAMDRYYYNEDQLVTRAEFADGSQLRYEYQGSYKVLECNQRNITTRWTYDGLGRMVTEEHQSGYYKEWIYDQNEDLICERDNLQKEIRYQYDNHHNCIKQWVKIDDTREQLIEKTYDSYGRVLVYQDANGGKTEYDYHEQYPDDGYGKGASIFARPCVVKTPMGESTTYCYDRIGRCMEIKNSYGTVSFGYNNRNYRCSYQNGEGEKQVYFYDSMGRMIAYYPPRSWQTKDHAYAFSYDFMGRETEMRTPLGDRYETIRNGEGDILKTIHPNDQMRYGGEKIGTRYEYDVAGNQIRIHYPDGGTERRFYDGLGNLIKKVEPEYYEETTDDGKGYEYRYDEQNHLTQVVNPDGVVTQRYDYDVYGNLLREWDDLGRDRHYRYDGLGNRTELWERVEEHLYRAVFYLYDRQGNKIKEQYGQSLTPLWERPLISHELNFSYDKNHHLIEVKDDDGACIRYVYDCLGNVLEERRRISGGKYSGDAAEDRTEVWQRIWYKYDKAGRRIHKREWMEGNGTPDAAITQYQYDKNGNLARIITPNGHRILREYDLADRLVKERTVDQTAGIDRTLMFTYDHAGNVTKVTQQGSDGEEMSFTYRYDWKNRMIAKETPDQGIWEYRYDKNDRLISEAFEEQTILFKSYDRQGNVIMRKNGLDQMVQELSYDSAGRLRGQRQSGQEQTEIAYTADGRQTRIKRGGRVLQESRYEEQGHLTGMMDGNQNETRFETDGWGKITKVIHPDGSEEAYAYNEAGLVTDTVDGNGNRISYQYNSFGKVGAITDQLGETEYFYYDKEGNCEKTIDRNGSCVITTYNVDGNILLQRAVDAEGKREVLNRYEYDSLGRLKRATGGGMCYTYEYTKAGRLERKCASGRTLLAYRYEKDGQLQSLTDVSGKTVFYEYDSLRRLKRLVDEQKQELVSYAYDEQNRLVQTRYGSGITTQYQYDENGNLSHQKTQSETRVFMDYHYQYDGNGNRTEKSGRIWSADGQLQKTSCFCYDQKNQLLEEQDGEQQTCYGYDQAGNRIWQEQGEDSFIFAYNARNQLIYRKGKTESTFYQYDKQGNLLEELTGEKRKQYQYDVQNRQQEVLQADGTFQKNRYDAEGLRAELEENGKLCRFIFHQGEIVAEERAGVAAVSRYLRGHGVEYLEQDEEQFLVLKDEQSSTVFLLDRDREIQNYYEYDAFGKVKESTGRIENRILYTGQQYDGVTGQYYLRARYYNPVIGRFIQEDPYRGDGLNLYAYCANNPVRYFDPSGYSGGLNCPGVGFEGRGNTNQFAQSPMFGEDWDAYFRDRYGAENVEWSSPRGIQYGFDDGLGELDWTTVVTKKGETRIDHINRHAVPRPDRETHGVFNGNPQDMVDQAWANRGSVTSVSDNMGGTVYNIPWENAGYESGYLNAGQQMDYITIIVKDESSELFVAFPSFGDYTTKGMK